MLYFLDSIFIFLTNILLYIENKVSNWGSKEFFESEPLTSFIKNNITEAIFLVTILSFLLNLITKYVKRKQHNIKAIRKIIEDAHLEIFGVKPASDGNSRITYYKSRFIIGIRPVFFKKWWPFLKLQFGWGKYLVIVSRTGCFQESKIKFKIDDDKEIENNGIAGKAWNKRIEIIREEKLPPANGARSSDYAKKSNIDQKSLKDFNVKASSILGLAIQNVDGTRAGVIVIDTKHNSFPQTIDQSVSKITEKLMYVV